MIINRQQLTALLSTFNNFTKFYKINLVTAH